MTNDETERTASALRHVRGVLDDPGQLVELLAEGHALYYGLGAAQVGRLRATILACFELVGLPMTALPYVLEELRFGFEPLEIAGAAVALRGSNSVTGETVALLGRALTTLQSNDAPVCFEIEKPCCKPPTTAMGEVLRTIARFGPRASALSDQLDCLANGKARLSPEVAAELSHAVNAVGERPAVTLTGCGCNESAMRSTIDDIRHVLLQDQSGATLELGDLFFGRPGLVTFFYTRCGNPAKCSASISRLTRLQAMLRRAKPAVMPSISAITYDPAYDTPQRLLAYGRDRGLAFDDGCRLLRTLGPFADLQAALSLGVGYGPVTVNRHRVELLVVDAGGRVRADFDRVQWDAQQVFDLLIDIDSGGPATSLNRLEGALPFTARH